MKLRSGTLLENTVARLFRLGGFTPKLNQVIKGYEIDVYVEYETIKLAIECKQYERSHLAIRNLIHEWESKNKIIGATKILFILVGCDISDTDKALAKKYGITIWDEDILNNLMDRAIKQKSKIKNELLIKAGLESANEINRQIKEIQDKFEVSKNLAISFLKGDITPKQLKLLKSVKLEGSLSKRAPKLLAEKKKYRGISFEKILKNMKKYNIKNIDLARLVTANKGGRVKGVYYSKPAIEKIKLVMDNAGLSFYKAKKFTKYYPSELKKAIKISKTENLPFEIAINRVNRITEEARIREKNKGCFIATAAYGSPYSPQVKFLQSMRDNKLKQTAYGRALVRGFEAIYYTFSPTIAEKIKRSSTAKRAVRWIVVAPIVYTLFVAVKTVRMVREITTSDKENPN